MPRHTEQRRALINEHLHEFRVLSTRFPNRVDVQKQCSLAAMLISKGIEKGIVNGTNDHRYARWYQHIIAIYQHLDNILGFETVQQALAKAK